MANFFFYTPGIISQQNHSRKNTFTKEFVLFLIYQDLIEQFRVEDWKSSIIEQTAQEMFLIVLTFVTGPDFALAFS